MGFHLNKKNSVVHPTPYTIRAPLCDKDNSRKMCNCA